MISDTQVILLAGLFGVCSSGNLLEAATHYDPAAAATERQLEAQYKPTKIGANGVTLVGGTVVVVQQDGIKVNPAFGDIYWPNLYKRGGRVKQPAIYIKNGVSNVVKDVRFLQVGERLYVTGIEVKDADVVFSLQTCDGAGADKPSAVPYRANVSFQFQKGFLNLSNFKEIQDTIGEVLAVAPPVTEPSPDSSAARGTQPLLALGPVYVNSQNNADRLQLGANGSFSLQEGGQSFSGTYSVTGATLKLHIVQLQRDVDVAIQGDRLIVNGGETWTQPSP